MKVKYSYYARDINFHSKIDVAVKLLSAHPWAHFSLAVRTDTNDFMLIATIQQPTFKINSILSDFAKSINFFVRKLFRMIEIQRLPNFGEDH